MMVCVCVLKVITDERTRHVFFLLISHKYSTFKTFLFLLDKTFDHGVMMRSIVSMDQRSVQKVQDLLMYQNVFSVKH